MTSQELGNLFEKASFAILEELFQNWGFQITDSKIQKSGTQLGFDLFFKIYRENCSLNIYVECKASKDPNEISTIELKDKIEQLEWANFPKKDVHILFSPSREIKLRNFETTIENDSYPFVIIDWTRKPKAFDRNLVMELFASYRGDDEDVNKYRDFLLTEIDDTFTTDKTFPEICEELKAEFVRRIDEHHGEAEVEEFRIINGVFWQRIQQNTDFELIHHFYTKIDSADHRLSQVVANDFYVRNEEAISSFEIKFDQAIKHRKSLIKILSQGGEGKSTFLFHLAKTLCEGNTVIWLDDVSSNVFGKIKNKIDRIITRKPLVFILDNPASFGEDLERFAEKLIRVFDKHNTVLITAERSFRYQEITERNNFEPLFDEVFDIYLQSKKITGQVFEKLITAFQKSDDFSEELIARSKTVFLQDKNLSIAEKTYSLIKFLTRNNKLKGYKFDWQDWEEFTDKKAPKLKNLYLLLATFYQFGNALDIEFCASFLNEVDFIEINIFKENKSLPIYKRGKHLFLRHEKLASWYLEDKIHFENSEYYFKQFLENINTEFTRNLFIWLCIKNKEFRNSEYAKLIDINKRAEIFRNYIDQNPKELKSRTELSKIYQRQGRWQEAERLLKEYIEIDPNGLHPRTELSKIYQQQKKWTEAEDILLEALEIDSQQLHPRTELSKIYQQQKKWTEAEDILLEALEIDSQQLHPRTELSKIYQQQKKWTEAEDILLELLELDKQNLQARTELSKIYQNRGRWKEAEDILLELLDLDKQNLQARTELSKTYQLQGKWKDAERLLKEYIEIDPNGLHPRTELSKIYQNQGRWQDAEDILLEALEIDSQQLHPRTELSKIYQRQGRWQEAIRIIKQCFKIDINDLNSRLELSKIYQKLSYEYRKQKKINKAEKYLNKSEKYLEECLKIDEFDKNSLLELGKLCANNYLRYEESENYLKKLLKVEPNSFYAKLELASLYRRTRRFFEYENLLFEINKDYPNDVPTLTALTRVFLRFKKYRIALELSKQITNLRKTDLIAICDLVKIYCEIRDKKNVDFYVEKGQKILTKDENHKHKERFENLRTDFDESVELVDFYKVGYFVDESGQRYIMSEDSEFFIVPENAVCNYNSLNQKVFFGVYSKDGKTFADFVEPYFDNIDDLQKLK